MKSHYITRKGRTVIVRPRKRVDWVLVFMAVGSVVLLLESLYLMSQG